MFKELFSSCSHGKKVGHPAFYQLWCRSLWLIQLHLQVTSPGIGPDSLQNRSEVIGCLTRENANGGGVKWVIAVVVTNNEQPGGFFIGIVGVVQKKCWCVSLKSIYQSLHGYNEAKRGKEWIDQLKMIERNVRQDNRLLLANCCKSKIDGSLGRRTPFMFLFRDFSRLNKFASWDFFNRLARLLSTAYCMLGIPTLVNFPGSGERFFASPLVELMLPSSLGPTIRRVCCSLTIIIPSPPGGLALKLHLNRQICLRLINGIEIIHFFFSFPF